METNLQCYYTWYRNEVKTNMTILHWNTKRAQRFITRYYDYCEGTELIDIYDSWSYDKEQAFMYCEDLFEKENGSHFRIISHNTFSFTVGWETVDGIRVETANNSYLIPRE